MSENSKVELTLEQTAVLQIVTAELAVRRNKVAEQVAILNNLLLVIGGEGATLAMVNGDPVVTQK